MPKVGCPSNSPGLRNRYTHIHKPQNESGKLMSPKGQLICLFAESKALLAWCQFAASSVSRSHWGHLKQTLLTNHVRTGSKVKIIWSLVPCALFLQGKVWPQYDHRVIWPRVHNDFCGFERVFHIVIALLLQASFASSVWQLDSVGGVSLYLNVDRSA